MTTSQEILAGLEKTLRYYDEEFPLEKYPDRESWFVSNRAKGITVGQLRTLTQSEPIKPEINADIAGVREALGKMARIHDQVMGNNAYIAFERILRTRSSPTIATDTKQLDPGMPTQELRLHMGELTANEVRVARAAIAWANSALSPNNIAPEKNITEREETLHSGNKNTEILPSGNINTNAPEASRGLLRTQPDGWKYMGDVMHETSDNPPPPDILLWLWDGENFAQGIFKPQDDYPCCMWEHDFDGDFYPTHWRYPQPPASSSKAGEEK